MGGHFQDRFVVACNRPECDANWASDDPAWLGKASMSRGHSFLGLKDLEWEWFNVLTFGFVSGLEHAIALLEDLRAAALHWASNTEGYSGPDRIGLYFHPYAH